MAPPECGCPPPHVYRPDLQSGRHSANTGFGACCSVLRRVRTEAGNQSHRLPSGQTINYSSFGALDARTGQILWQVPEPHGGRSIGPVTYTNGVVYVGSMNNYMYALDANNGQVLWEFQGAGSSNAGPAIVGGWLYWGNGYSRGGTASTRFYSFRVSGSPTTSPTVSPTVSPTTPPTGACSATYSVVNQWSDGFQAEVTVQAGSGAIDGWSVQWSFANGQAISQIWNATMSASGANAIPAPITCTSP